MKRVAKLGLALAVFAMTLTSCNCFKKVEKRVDELAVTCNPTVLSLNGDLVSATVTVNVPESFFQKTATVKITPVLKYDGGEIEGTPKYVQGESVKDNYQVVPYATASTVSHTFSFPYNEDARLSVLELRLEARCTKDPVNKPADFIALSETIEVANGVSVIQGLAVDLAKNYGQLAFCADNYKKVTTISKEANIMFDISRANVKTSELTSYEIKELQDFIKENLDDPKKSLSDLYTKAYASPDGPLSFNDKLSQERGKNTHTAVKKQFKKDKMPVEPTFDVDAIGEDWEGFKELVIASSIPEKDVILQILNMYSDPAKRDAEIKNMASVFEILAEKVLPQLRRSKLIQSVEVQGLTDDELRSAVAGDINSLSIEELLYAATLYTDNSTKEKIYKVATKNFSGCYRAWNNLGAVRAQEGDFNEAKNCFTKAAKINSSSQEVANNLGVVALFEGDKVEAKGYLASLTIPEAKYNLGLVALAEGDYAAATNGLTGYNLAVVEVCNGNLSRAKAILAKEDSAAASYLKAIIAAKEGDKSTTYFNLGAACSQDASYKAEAVKTVEFLPYFDDADFKAIVK
ncbi:MAG: tetratricopeptide repeat protein [Rikenellaceae bacterium]